MLDYVYVTYEQFAFTPEEKEMSFFKKEDSAVKYLIDKGYIKEEDEDNLFSNNEEQMLAWVTKHEVK